MFNNIYYHQTIRKCVAVFGSLFNNISIVRRDENGVEIKRLLVPIAYGPRERYLGRTIENPELNRDYAIDLPRVCFEISSIRYDGTRKLNTMHKNIKKEGAETGDVRRVFTPVSYLLGVDLHIMAKFIDDANQILEQILPFFTPDYTVTVNSIPELELLDDMPIVLNGVSMQDNYESDWMERRNVIYTLNYEVKTLFYGPVKDDKIVTKAINSYRIEDEALLEYNVQPKAGSTLFKILGYDEEMIVKK